MKRTSPSSRAAARAATAPSGTERDVPLVGLDEVVQLDQVDLVDIHPGERSLELGASVGASTFAGLRGEEHLGPVIGEPRPQPTSDSP